MLLQKLCPAPQILALLRSIILVQICPELLNSDQRLWDTGGPSWGKNPEWSWSRGMKLCPALPAVRRGRLART